MHTCAAGGVNGISFSHSWGYGLLPYEQLPEVCFILAFSMAAGTLFGIACSSSYVDKHDIRVSH
jgi:hypothetical protein